MSVIEKPAKTTPYDIVTDKILALLEEGTVPWHQPWSRNGLPASMSTGKPYRGINPFLLNMSSMAEGYNSRWWATYDQIAALGGQVRKGEQSTLIVFWKRGAKVEIVDGQEKKKSWAMLRYFRVFNADQADWPDGVPAKFLPPPLADHDPIADAQRIFDGYIGRDDTPSLRLGGDHAYYTPVEDRIQLPLLGRFDTAEEFYSAAFHEATHSTGHPSRLQRDGVQLHRFGSMPTYAKEELIAEMGAAMLCAEAGIDQVTLENSAAYLESWIKTIRGDSKLIVSAAAQAQKAVDLILGTVFEEDNE